MKSKLTLVIGNKNYSSWSLRPWIFMKHTGIDFEEIRIPLYDPKFDQEISKYSPSGKVPVLLDGDLEVWDSLAICEYIAEKFPESKAWPQEATLRARARAIASEMHSGFLGMRHALPMNCRKSFQNFSVSTEAQEDIDRIQQIWNDCLQKSQGPWLFGHFTIADAMFAPVALRLSIYNISLTETSRLYVDTVKKTPAIQEWITGAKNETEVIPAFEK